MSGKDDGLVFRHFRHERSESVQNVAVGHVDGFVRLRLVGEERADGRLAVARRPDRAGAVEGARHGLDENIGTLARGCIVQIGVPVTLFDVARRVDEENGGLRGPYLRREAGGQPLRGIVLLRHVWPCDPHPGIVVGIVGKRRARVERAIGHEGHFRQVFGVERQHQPDEDVEHQQDGDDVEELASHGGCLSRGQAPGSSARLGGL